MKSDSKYYYRRALSAVGATAALGLLYSCASIGNPSGGPRDEDPPRVVRTVPEYGSTEVKGRRIAIDFDELVNVKDAFTNVVVSPPQASAPKVISNGRRVWVEWDEDLLPGTTYTVDFGTSIEDVNEGNPLGNYSFSFSTGPELDSLRIGGMVLDAATLEPQQGVLVGVHSAEAPDSAFRTLRFERATKTDDRGRFTLRGLKAKPYNLFALADVNNDYRWDNPAELIAFYPTPITPYAEQEMTTDTLYNPLTGAVDSVASRQRTLFLPNNLLLSMFDIGYKPQYLVKYERTDSARLSFILNAPTDTLPRLSILSRSDRPWMLEHTLHRDTLTYWLTDPELIQADTLRVAFAYPRTDTKQMTTNAIDTLTLTKPRVHKAKKSGKRTRQQIIADSIADEKAKWIALSAAPAGGMNIYAPLVIETPEPLTGFNSSMMRLEQKVDSLYKPLPLPALVQDTTGNIRRYTMLYPWEYGTSYRLSVDSTAAVGVSGRPTATLSHEFTVKKREDYASLTLRLVPDTVHGFVEVLNASDSPVASAEVVNGKVSFPFLSPADYYVRFTTLEPDTTGNVGELTFRTGSYDDRTQPSDVYYYPKVLSLKRYDRSEQWDLNSTSVDMQKPEQIKKNKPKRKAVKRGKNGEAIGGENEEEDDYFDVNSNPFDPKSSRRGRGKGNAGNFRLEGH